MSDKGDGGNSFEKRLWEAADQMRANSNLKASQYSMPVLGLIFLKFADHRFQRAKSRLEAQGISSRRGVSESDYHALGVMYLPLEARWGSLLNLPEGANTGKAINEAMEAIEGANETLRGALPRNYPEIENRTLVELVRIFDTIPMDTRGDKFGRIYEYFLGKFAMTEGQGGGEFYTPTSIVRLIVEILEPNQGRILDPACGSGGMFVQSARFLENHHNNPDKISVYGMEKTAETVNLAIMNLAVHQLSGQIRSVNSYYEDPFNSPGKFHFVMANPPFNVDKIDKERIKDDTARYPLGMPRNDNGNYIWIQMFLGALNSEGRAGFVMANSASDARHSEQDIRRKLIERKVVDVMVLVSSNFFYTVTLPCTLWFLDKGKEGTDREDKVLFIDAREIYRQVDRAHRDFTDAQIEFIANIVRMYRNQEVELTNGSEELLSGTFEGHEYKDVLGLCKVAALSEIEEQGWSLNPGRYVGVAEREEDDFDLAERLEELFGQLVVLNSKASELEERIAENISKLLGGLGG